MAAATKCKYFSVNEDFKATRTLVLSQFNADALGTERQNPASRGL